MSSIWQKIRTLIPGLAAGVATSAAAADKPPAGQVSDRHRKSVLK